MIKRRFTLQNSQKSKRNKITQYLLQLDRCMQIPNDDKLLIRKKIKDNEEDIISLFQLHKKDKNYHELQIKLRKIIQIEKNYEKRYTINHADRERKKSEYNQRIYSQNSQNASFKNSAKNSPQKQDNKKAIITFDICELKKKMEECSQLQKKINYHMEYQKSKNPIRISSTHRMNTSMNKSRQNSLDRLPLKQQKSTQYGANGNIAQYRGNIMNSLKQNSSKITLRISQRKSPSKENAEKRQVLRQPSICEAQKQQRYNQYTQQGSNFEGSYSSSIKNLLMSKLKDQKQVKKEKIILKNNSKYQENLASNRSLSEFQQHTALKKSIKPMTRDEIIQHPKHFEENNSRFAMYIQTTQQSEDERATQKKLQQFGYHKQSKGRNEKLETLINLEAEEQKYGHFYMKIKNIINSKNY